VSKIGQDWLNDILQKRLTTMMFELEIIPDISANEENVKLWRFHSWNTTKLHSEWRNAWCQM